MNSNFVKYVGTCLDPYKIKDDTHHTYVKWNCGHCEQCLLDKSQRFKQAVSNEFLHYKYCIFFTLTYDNNSIPRIAVTGNKGFPRFETVGRSENLVPFLPWRPYLVRHRGSDFYHNYEYVRNGLEYEEFPTIQNDISGKPNEFGVLCYRDVTLFKKRLRQSLSKYLGYVAKFSIYYCGEYGETKFRPHYHVLFFCNDENICSSLPLFRNIVYSCWGKRTKIAGHGRNYYSFRPYASYSLFTCQGEVSLSDKPNFSYVDSESACSSYVASYLNSYSKLPLYLRFRPWQPKHITPRGASRFFGCDDDILDQFLSKCNIWLQTYNISSEDLFFNSVPKYDEGRQDFVSVRFRFPVLYLHSLFLPPVGFAKIPIHEFAKSHEKLLRLFVKYKENNLSHTQICFRLQEHCFKFDFSKEQNFLWLSRGYDFINMFRCSVVDYVYIFNRVITCFHLANIQRQIEDMNADFDDNGVLVQAQYYDNICIPLHISSLDFHDKNSQFKFWYQFVNQCNIELNDLYYRSYLQDCYVLRPYFQGLLFNFDAEIENYFDVRKKKLSDKYYKHKTGFYSTI